jgi:hypothetical protein
MPKYIFLNLVPLFSTIAVDRRRALCSPEVVVVVVGGLLRQGRGLPTVLVHGRRSGAERRTAYSGMALQPGTNVMIFNIFSPKNWATKLAFFAQFSAM